MTQQFENFVNAALDKSLASDVTLPTANKIPVFTGIGRQVTGKTATELGIATTSYVDTAVTKVWKDQGDYNVSGGTAWPTSANTIGAVPIKAGFLWVVSGAAVDGTTLTGGKVVSNGDTIRALVDAATNAGADWGVNEANLGYTPENQNNKDTDGTLAANSDTKYPSQKAVKTYADTKQPADATLTALAGLNATAGVLVQTGADTFTKRTLTGTEGQVTVTNGNGVEGDPTISLPASGVTANTYGSASVIPVLTVNAQGVVTLVTTAAVASPAVFSDSAFRVQDNGNATKQIAFEVSGITSGQTRTITVPDANVNLGLIGTVPEYVNGATYVVGNEVTYLEILYICRTAHTSNTGSPDLTKFYQVSGASNLDKYGLTQYYENYVASTGIRKVFKQYASTFNHTGDKTMTVDIVLGNSISWYNNGIARLYNIKVMAYRDDGHAPRTGALIMDKRVIVARGTEAGADTIIGIPLLEDIKTYLFGMFSASTFTASIIDSGGNYHLILTLTCPNIATTVSAIMLVETISCD